MTLTLKKAIEQMDNQQMIALYKSLPFVTQDAALSLPDTRLGNMARLAVESVIHISNRLENEAIRRGFDIDI